MLIISEKQIESMYDMSDALYDVKRVLTSMTKGKIENPIRTVIDIPDKTASAVYMPSADLVDKVATLKAVTIFPENPTIGKPTTQGLILLTDATNGEHLAIMDASYLTRVRTGALTGLATNQLARTNAKTLTVIGTGGMAFDQVLGVLAVRSIERIYLVNPTYENAVDFKEKLQNSSIDDQIQIDIIEDVTEAVKRADVICCSTRSDTPVFDGADIKAGTHVNGVGSYLPTMREVDFEFIKRANKIVVDDLEGCQEEAGEIIHANKQKNWGFDDIHGELKELVTNQIDERTFDDEITFFKSVGAAYFDLAVAKGVYRKATELNVGTKAEI